MADVDTAPVKESHKVLGVAKDADHKSVMKAYRKLLKDLNISEHPSSDYVKQEIKQLKAARDNMVGRVPGNGGSGGRIPPGGVTTAQAQTGLVPVDGASSAKASSQKWSNSKSKIKDIGSKLSKSFGGGTAKAALKGASRAGGVLSAYHIYHQLYRKNYAQHN